MPTVKINFQLETDDDGYPPVSVEALWATSEGDGYVIDSIPFFARDATNGDLVGAHRGAEGALWFDTVLQRSPNSLIRIVLFDLASEEGVVNQLVQLGCGVERMPEFKLLAVDIPSNVSLGVIQRYVQDQAQVGVLDYEEPILRQ